ncbi:MAG: 2-oxoacid:acceptor oxidoreductase subunit alpha [Deltaproteobacteria bacterium]|nr:MAG: 2-oxoacid:acceptor oxidoreductase subunit alpha [Deltaproteobacteria bacterium]
MSTTARIEPGPNASLDSVVIRFAGDSGDGMQLIGNQFTRTSALAGNDLATLPDFPAEIRAPAGTRAGVSGFQLQFANHDIFTPGDIADVLVAMNPAALVANLGRLKDGGLIIVNNDKFASRDLKLANLEQSPLEDGTVENYRVVEVGITKLTKDTVEPLGLTTKEADRCKNFFALGMMYWLYSRNMGPTEDWVRSKFKGKYADANLAALRAGWSYAETVEIFAGQPYMVPRADDFDAGEYRNIMGNAALAVGLAAAATKADRPLFYGTYPITPASDILHALAPFKNYGVVTYQAEDEIAAVCAAIGASWGGSIGVTGTSGPGIALKAEAMGLANIVELPLIVVNVQRGGPSTGLPTKTEQSDLLQVMYGRNGDSPMPILAPKTPADCFEVAIEAVKIAFKYMTPVVIMSDGYIANGAEPWKLPDLDTIPEMKPTFAKAVEGEEFQAYSRNPETLARPWAIPGTPGLEHRVGGLEKQHLTGHVSYDPPNHQFMQELRRDKVNKIRQDIPATEIHGDDSGLCVLTWGSTYGAARTAVNGARKQGKKVGHVHLRWLNPLPADLGDVLAKYDRVLVPELNLGQLVKLIRAEYLIDAQSLSKVQGQPFTTNEILSRILEEV